jgi:membrane-associated phospholipid phosphatase
MRQKVSLLIICVLRESLKSGKRNIRMTSISKNRASVLLLAALLTIISYLYLDTEIVRFVNRILSSNEQLWQITSNIPDLLQQIVLLITVFSWIGYFILRRRGVYGHLTDFLLTCGVVMPLAFIAKEVLQYVFGRPNPHAWLLVHSPPRFYWFRGYGAFPSGHMTVFTALLITFSHHYPRYRSAGIGLLIVLALALIFTDYHFLSDVLAGAVVGSLLAFSANKILRKQPA